MSGRRCAGDDAMARGFERLDSITVTPAIGKAAVGQRQSVIGKSGEDGTTVTAAGELLCCKVIVNSISSWETALLQGY